MIHNYNILRNNNDSVKLSSIHYTGSRKLESELFISL